MDERDGVEYPEQQTQSRQSLLKKTKSEIKQEKKMSKTESRFKSKLESLKKLQHSASTNGAVEKARAFFRSLELKHLGSSSSNDQSSSSSPRRRRHETTAHDYSSSEKFPPPSSMSSSSSSSVIDDSHNTISLPTTNDSSLYMRNPTDGIATARLIRIINSNYSNSNDMIVHHVIRDDPSSYLNYHQMLLERNIHSPKQFDNERSQSYSVSMEKHREMQTKYDSRPLSPVSSMNSNIIYSSHIYPNSSPKIQPIITNGNISNQPMSTSLYNYRPLVCRHLESPSLMSSSFHEPSDRIGDSLIRPLPSSSSSSFMSTWNQSVRRLNSEYTSTINALQQAKESLQDIYSERTDSVSKYANLVSRGIDNLSYNESKKSLGVTFCLTTPMSPKSPSISTTSRNSIEQNRTPSSNMFCKPKLVRPLDLDTFIPSIPKLEPIPSIPEKNEKTDSIANIIKKFNNLNYSSTSLKSQTIIENPDESYLTQFNQEQRETLPKMIVFDSIQTKKDQSHLSSLTSLSDLNPSFSISSPRVHFEPSITTYEIEEIPYESPPPPITSSSSSSSSSSISEDSTRSSSASIDENQVYENIQLDNTIQEETTYTVETFYKSAGTNESIKCNSPSTNQQVVVIRENTTEEQFNSAREKLRAEKSRIRHSPLKHTFTMNETEVPPLTTPLLTYLNLTVKQTSPIRETKEKFSDNYHSLEPLLHVPNNFISSTYHAEDQETTNDVVTINPHTYSPPSHRLNSSSSSSSTVSSASTVLLSQNTISILPISTQTTNGNLTKNNNKSVSQLPKRTISNTATATTTITTSRLKQPTKNVASSSKLKPPSSTISKPLKSMFTNNSSSVTPSPMATSSIRKPTGITNHSSTLSNNVVNKTTQHQSSLSPLTIGKKQNLSNGNNMTDSQNLTESSSSLGKNRVRSMINQLNAAVSSTTRPVVPPVIPAKRVPTFPSTVNLRRPDSVESPASPPPPAKPTITTPSRPTLQRAMTINTNRSGATSPSSTTTTTTNNNIPSAYKRRTPLIRSTSNVKEGLLRWCQAQVAEYPNVSVTNLSSSWSDGLAFCALTHHFFPDAFDFNSLSPTNRKDNFELAFHVAEERAGVPRLLDVSDMILMGNTPDYKCIFTYLNSFLAKVKDRHPTSNGVEHH
ncbi:hypothetical protein I4U23_031000 [Adineta vaga]|nr:hypothetical protein I4U23_031000 [Adineta vaga]